MNPWDRYMLNRILDELKRELKGWEYYEAINGTTGEGERLRGEIQEIEGWLEEPVRFCLSERMRCKGCEKAK